jgi:hypothetical protein
MRFRNFAFATSTLLLGLGLACGGGSSTSTSAPARPAPASGLAYVDPTGSGWRLVKDATSTSTRLVLNLVGPTGLRTRGVGFNLQAPSTVKFGAFPNGLALQDTGVYQLRGVGSVDAAEPVALVGGVKPGNVLTVGIFQKDRAQAAQDSGVALCQIALVFDAAQGLAKGEVLPLQVRKARAIPEDIGTSGDDLWSLDKKLKMTDLSVALGTLSAQ